MVELIDGAQFTNSNSTMLEKGQKEVESGKVRKGGKGGVTTWKRLAIEKENVVPVVEIKKRIFNDLTNGKGDMYDGVVPNMKKVKQNEVEEGYSDHLSILLDLEYFRSASHRHKGKIFCFEQMWTTHEECEKLIREEWEKGRIIGGVGVGPILESVKETLTKWNKAVFGRWRRELMRQYFSEDEITAITRLPLNARKHDDRWTWSLTQQGGFSVKTAYHATHSTQNTMEADMDYSKVWRVIWKMNTLPSTKLFIWRVVKEILPTIEALCRRGCGQVLSFWASTGLPFVFEGEGEKIWERGNKAQLEELVTGLEGLWHQVNETWKAINEGTESVKEKAKASPVRWQAPTWRFLKLNVDAS
ncbi:reverse transcriptase [Senna tora]|uniref:Reverse transcriptase n=1 Tax=Senna tora TaxID=362788 RepID=A0A834SE95_9FABA|nr:reverse transcriptase [Senna tora]